MICIRSTGTMIDEVQKSANVVAFCRAPLCYSTTQLQAAFPSVSPCVCVCPSVTRWYRVKTNDCKIMRFSPLDSPGTVVVRHQLLYHRFQENPLRGRQTRLAWLKHNENAYYQTIINRYISETIEDKHIYNGIGKCIQVFDWYQFRWPRIIILNDRNAPPCPTELAV